MMSVAIEKFIAALSTLFMSKFLLWKHLVLVPLVAPGRVAQSAGHLTRKSGVLGSIPDLATYQ